MNTTTPRRIALVAHDHKKPDLLAWTKAHREELSRMELCATGTTGKLLAEATGLPIERLQSGPLGGDQQIGARISEGEIDVLIFFWDPLQAQPHDPDVKALLRLATVWNIPMACNQVTADMLMVSLAHTPSYPREVPSFQNYLNRSVGSAKE